MDPFIVAAFKWLGLAAFAPVAVAVGLSGLQIVVRTLHHLDFKTPPPKFTKFNLFGISAEVESLNQVAKDTSEQIDALRKEMDAQTEVIFMLVAEVERIKQITAEHGPDDSQ